MSKYLEKKLRLNKQIENTEEKIKKEQDKLKKYKDQLVELENFEIQSILKEEEVSVTELRSLIKELAEKKVAAELEQGKNNIMTTENVMNTNHND